MTILIRPPRPEDYPALAEIHNQQNEPDWHTTPERLAATDNHRAATEPHFRRLVMEDTGHLIATGTIHPDFGNPPAPSRRWVYLYCHPNHRGKGHDRQLLVRALELDPERVTEVATTIRADFVGMTSFLEPEGFEELYRTWGSHLDLARFEARVFEPLIAAIESQGIRLAAYGSLPQSPELVARIVGFQRKTEKDAVAFEPVIPRKQDDLRSEHVMPHTVTLALTGDDEIIGIASLVGPPHGEMIESGFTGVARMYRNRGIATALGARTAAIAKELGFLDLNAAGAGADTPIMAVKRKLGYFIEPAWITFTKTL